MDGSGKCDALQTDVAADRVWGGVYAIPERERESLNRAEGLGCGYEMKRVTVHALERTIEAEMFAAIRIDASMRPFAWYKHHVVRGAMDLELPTDYVAAIEAIRAEDDPDADRTRRELGRHSDPRTP